MRVRAFCCAAPWYVLFFVAQLAAVSSRQVAGYVDICVHENGQGRAGLAAPRHSIARPLLRPKPAVCWQCRFSRQLLKRSVRKNK